MKLTFSGILFLFLTISNYAFPVPELRRQVTDLAGILSPETVAQLELSIVNHERETSNQIAVLTLPSLEGEVISDVAIQVFDEWKLGQKSKNNGVLLLIAKEERKIWISVGRGLEGALTDLLARQIVLNEIRPKFKANDMDSGVLDGVNAIIKTIQGEYQPSSSDVNTTKRVISPRETFSSAISGLVFTFFSLMVGSLFGAIVTAFGLFLLYPVFSLLFGPVFAVIIVIVLFFLLLFLKSKMNFSGFGGGDGGYSGGGWYSGGSSSDSWSSGGDSWGGGGGDSAGGGSGGDW